MHWNQLLQKREDAYGSNSIDEYKEGSSVLGSQRLLKEVKYCTYRFSQGLALCRFAFERAGRNFVLLKVKRLLLNMEKADLKVLSQRYFFESWSLAMLLDSDSGGFLVMYHLLIICFSFRSSIQLGVSLVYVEKERNASCFQGNAGSEKDGLKAWQVHSKSGRRNISFIKTHEEHHPEFLGFL